ncbi:histidine--tRNA ligase 1 [Firmicutes bacterium CAG:884]|nr:histidine--tRNA ligase [Bacillota bacterium]CCY93575.1 histidine--tRNA ligase 1 [Firmicutes bacterium CAG:884]
MKLRNLKGTEDFLFKDQVVRNKIIDTLKQNFEKYGYMPIETPILNYYDLLALKYEEGDEILNEIYRLSDQGNRDIGLRYDLTVPFCKVVGMQKELRLPFRRYEIGKVFRNGPVKLGRTREFYQCDVDVVGIDGRLIETEQIVMAIEIFKCLGIDINVLYNNRKFMNGLLIEAGISNPTFGVIGILDKLDKVDRKTIYKMFNDEGIDNSIVDNIFNIFGKSLDEYNVLYKDSSNELLKNGLNELNDVTDSLKKLNYLDNITFDSYLSRGLEIYTGIVFEFRDKLKRLTGSLGAGGRYDKIITNFINDGNVYPAVGLSFGLEPIYVILKNEEKFSLVDYYIIPMNTEIECLELASKMRDKGKRVLIEMNNRKIKKSFDYANKENIPYVIVIGENEIKENKITIKNMNEGSQEMIDIDEFLRRI